MMFGWSTEDRNSISLLKQLRRLRLSFERWKHFKTVSSPVNRWFADQTVEVKLSLSFDFGLYSFHRWSSSSSDTFSISFKIKNGSLFRSSCISFSLVDNVNVTTSFRISTKRLLVLKIGPGIDSTLFIWLVGLTCPTGWTGFWILLIFS